METRDKLLDIWKDILGKEDIGYTDNIMEIGGDSRAIYGITMLARERYQLDLSPMDVMMYPNIEALEKFLNGENAASGDTSEVRVARRRRARS